MNTSNEAFQTGRRRQIIKTNQYKGQISAGAAATPASAACRRIGSSSPQRVLRGMHFIPPNTDFARAVINMGNEPSYAASDRNPLGPRSSATTPTNSHQQQCRQHHQERPMSNLSVLMRQQEQEQETPGGETTAAAAAAAATTATNLEDNANSPSSIACEADSASGPPPPTVSASSAPPEIHRRRRVSPVGLPVEDPTAIPRQFSTGMVTGHLRSSLASSFSSSRGDRVRRCLSSKELGTLAPPSGSPYAHMLSKKEELETSMRDRLLAMREACPPASSSSQDHASRAGGASDESTTGGSTTSSRRPAEGVNELRNRRRAAHNQAVVEDLCNVVADLFIAESKLLKPLLYGVEPDPSNTVRREPLVKCIHDFVSALPNRYALGADTPSEVLLHMRLMAAARSDKTKAAVHIHNLEGDCNWNRAVAAASVKHHKLLRLVTIAACDQVGLLEYITRLLSSGGSSVVDADVMLSTDGIVLDRFVVEMKGRLRLDTLANLIESFLRASTTTDQTDDDVAAKAQVTARAPSSSGPGPLYTVEVPGSEAARDLRQEIETAVPLTEVLASSLHDCLPALSFPKLRKLHSMPNASAASPCLPNVRLSMRRDSQNDGVSIPDSPELSHQNMEPPERVSADVAVSMREKRPLVNRRGRSDLDRVEATKSEHPPLDYVTVPISDVVVGSGGVQNRVILIPFDELMLIETLGTGRVGTIYRAAWKRGGMGFEMTNLSGVIMVALKVAMVNSARGDTSHVDELRREADIAARLDHPNICDLVGVAADSDCFCLAYDYCEGGSLLSLLSDSRRYYEYLPIALDIANGMAYLHSRNVIHRDLKPSNILLTRDHRAKIADFGMSVANTGQELTAETGTYRYMAPEVIRHESYSSNADVYSFGICLWQLITREVPFATMTPIQAAYAVAEGHRPTIPPSTPRRLQEIILACWDQDSHRRPSFTYIAMALADYAKMAFSPANVGALTLQIANEMLSNVEGNSTVNVDFTTPVAAIPPPSYVDGSFPTHDSIHSNVGLEIE